jgi:hypothetical protein
MRRLQHVVLIVCLVLVALLASAAGAGATTIAPTGPTTISGRVRWVIPGASLAIECLASSTGVVPGAPDNPNSRGSVAFLIETPVFRGCSEPFGFAAEVRAFSTLGVWGIAAMRLPGVPSGATFVSLGMPPAGVRITFLGCVLNAGFGASASFTGQWTGRLTLTGQQASAALVGSFCPEESVVTLSGTLNIPVRIE